MATTQTIQQPGSARMHQAPVVHDYDRATTGTINGWSVLAGSLMVLGGIFQFFQGLAAVLNGNLFVATTDYLYSIDISTWGWVHLIVGAIIGLAGLGVFAGQTWARVTGIVLAMLSATINFFFIPYYPLWSILIIVLDIGIIFGLANYGRRGAVM